MQLKFTRNKPNKYLNGVARARYAGVASYSFRVKTVPAGK